MKALSLTLFVFAMVILLSSAFPMEKEKDGISGLLKVENPHEQEKFLQRRRPPAKVPGPKFGGDDEEEGNAEEDDSKSKKKGKKGLRSSGMMRSYDLDALDNSKTKKGRGKNHFHSDYAYLNEEIGNLLNSQ